MQIDLPFRKCQQIYFFKLLMNVLFFYVVPLRLV